jgi:hypothetical protein
MMTEFEAGVRELVARLRDFERRLKKTEDDAGALDQMVKLITPGLGFGAKDCVRDFPFVCDCIPPILKVVDSVYGDCPITYDSANLWWRGCRIVSFPGSITCTTPATTFIRYTLHGTNATTTWAMQVEWHGTTDHGNLCPTNGKTCADVPNRSASQNGTMGCIGSGYWIGFFSGSLIWATGATLTVQDP